MFLRELKINFKSFLIWMSVLLGLMLVVFLVYPSIMNSENIKLMDEYMKMFPEEMLVAFNMDISSIDTAYGWLKTEGFVLLLLIMGCYSGILGSQILLKEENDKTIEYLNSLPITRRKIVFSKAFSGVFYIVIMVLLLGIFNYIGLTLTEEFDHTQYLLLSLTPLFSSISIYFLCFFLSAFTHKTKKMLGVSLGISFASYLFHTLSTISEEVEFLKYFSVFTLADTRNVILEVSINPIMILITIGVSFLFFLLALVRYQKKELI